MIKRFWVNERFRTWDQGPAVLAKIADHSLLMMMGFLVLAPFLWMISTSLKPAEEIFGHPLSLIPQHYAAWSNYSHALAAVPMLRFMMNGVIVVFGIISVQITIALFAAYALAKLEFRGRNLLLAFVLFGLCVPIQVPALPLYLGLAKLHALDTYFALMAPFLLSVFAIFLFRQFFRSFPDEILHAARLDGFTELEIVLRLMLPSARPAIAAFAVFSITAHWNDLYWPMIAVTSFEHSTPPLGMLMFSDGEMGANYGPLAAGAVIVTLPVLITFLLAQRQFVRGITMTGFK